jgi:hypothetical protein
VSKAIRIYATQQSSHKPEVPDREGIVLLRNSGDNISGFASYLQKSYPERRRIDFISPQVIYSNT